MKANQIKEMFELQEELEVRIGGKDWRNAGHNYPLCIFMECAEIIDKIGWKHWKFYGEPDMDQILMELVDVWHFALADSLRQLPERKMPVDEASLMMAQMWDEAEAKIPGVKVDPIDWALHLGVLYIEDGRLYIEYFIRLLRWTGYDFEMLYRLYVGKNVLNNFRQDHGYAEGTYLKHWAGREDNYHLFELTEQLGDSFNKEELARALAVRYSLATGN